MCLSVVVVCACCAWVVKTCCHPSIWTKTHNASYPSTSPPSLIVIASPIQPHSTHSLSKGQIARGMTVGKYLIIGGTGGIGRMLANRLVMKYHKVSARSAEGEAEGEGRRSRRPAGVWEDRCDGCHAG